MSPELVTDGEVWVVVFRVAGDMSIGGCWVKG